MPNYKLIRSNRKTMALEITPDCEILVRAPLKMPEKTIEQFVSQHKAWIEKAMQRQQKRALSNKNLTAAQITELKQKAAEILPLRVEYFSKITGLVPTGIKITSAKKRFGSCSPKNSICFSYILMQYPIEAIDYVVLHELIHIKHHDHSDKFWSLLSKYMPDYKQRRRILRG